MAGPRTFALCADDFGLSAAVDRGILRLVVRSRLSAVSCLVNAPDWAAAAGELAAAAQGSVRLGLHFNLTEGRPLSPALARLWPRLPALPHLIVQAHLRRLPRAALREELAAQLHAFEQARGAAPDHLDGHQHVHHLPQVRELVLEVLAARPRLTVRSTASVLGPGHAGKRLIIERSGGRALGRQLQRMGRQANRHLLGVYDFAATDYGRLMRAWLAAMPAQGGLLFCHPGGAAGGPGDPIAGARVRELAYLDSDAFVDDLVAANARLA